MNLIVIIILGFSTRVNATLSIPQGLSQGEQEILAEIVGFGTSYKLVNDPYPLGGYSGVEMGLSLESLPTGDIGYFGRTAPTVKNVVYPKITFGKGLIRNFDMFFGFIPVNSSTGVALYSGALRWGFFQATYIPACFILVLSGTSTNFQNLIFSQSQGVDLVTGINVDPFSFTLGAGLLNSETQFDPTITSALKKTSINSRTLHLFFGGTISIGDAFAALQIDHYTMTTVAMKLGARF